MREYAQGSAISETKPSQPSIFSTLQNMYVTELKYRAQIDERDEEIKLTDCHEDWYQAF